MNKRILTLCLALILCLSLVPEQCFAVSAPKQAVIKEAPVAGVAAYNRGGLGLIEEKDGTFHLIDRDGGIYRSGKAWMDYMAGSGSYIVNGEGYYEYPLGRTMFTMPEMEKNVKAFLVELNRKKPIDAKAGFVRSVSLSSTMGPGVWIDYKEEA